MNPSRFFVLVLWAVCTVAPAQQVVYRCGNEYTNDAVDAKNRGCKVLGGGNLTVVPALAPVAPTASVSKSVAPPVGQKVDSVEQRARDADAKGILETELRKAEQKRDQLRQEFNNGQPEKMGPEARNHQKYLDRVADMRSQIARLDADIASLRRELGRAVAKPNS